MLREDTILVCYRVLRNRSRAEAPNMWQIPAADSGRGGRTPGLGAKQQGKTSKLKTLQQTRTQYGDDGFTYIYSRDMIGSG